MADNKKQTEKKNLTGNKKKSYTTRYEKVTRML